MIPYIPTGDSRCAKAILLHQGLAQLVNIMRMEEEYSLSCGFFLLPESVLMGKEATIMIHPYLSIHGRTASLKLLKNIKCVLQTTRYADDITSTKTFSNLSISEKEELLIKFQVNANLKFIIVSFSADIDNKSKNITQTLKAFKNFMLENYTNKACIAEVYLQLNDKNDYALCFAGKNGEPVKGAVF